MTFVTARGAVLDTPEFPTLLLRLRVYLIRAGACVTRQLPDALNQIQRFLSVNLTNHVAEQFAQRTDFVTKSLTGQGLVFPGLPLSTLTVR